MSCPKDLGYYIINFLKFEFLNNAENYVSVLNEGRRCKNGGAWPTIFGYSFIFRVVHF